MICLLIAPSHVSRGQDAVRKSAGKPADKPQAVKTPEFPAQIELLETKIRFEADGSSRKEVHARVKISNELGVSQFARLNFDYNRSFEQVEIPLVRITHASGGIAELLPSAITDNPHPAVVDAPAYQDVRVKSVRILGLGLEDSLEYRVITIITHHPLAPDFWIDHSFDRSGVVSQEIFELDVPTSRQVQIHINPAIPASSNDKSGEGDSARTIYRWQRLAVVTSKPVKEAIGKKPDVVVTTFSSWDALSSRLAESFQAFKVQPEDWVVSPEILQEAKVLSENAKSPLEKIESVYSFVSGKLRTIDLPLGSTGFAGHSPGEILASQYATAEDKYVLFAALSRALRIDAFAALVGAEEGVRDEPPRPSPFTHLLMAIAFADNKSVYWLDPSLDVAPFNMLPSNDRGTLAFVVARNSSEMDLVTKPWDRIPDRLPFAASQTVSVEASIGADGTLTAKVHYTLRGDNELLLRVAFHQAPKDKWNELAQLLALSDGFRGQVSNVTASDPNATDDPFTLEYEIATPKFVDWSKKPIRIPALLPQLGLPDPPAKPAAGQAAASINLGTPLDVHTTLTLHLPPGTTVRIPTGTSVERDYATFASQYNAKSSVVTATRRLNFILRDVPAGRAVDYNAFLRVVQNDEAQEFTLERSDISSPKTKSAEPILSAPPKPATAKP